MPPSTTPPTPRGRRTAANIRAAGREILEENGYSGASVLEITKRAGVALGTFYRYYTNKEELFLALLHDLTEELYESVIDGDWITTSDTTGSQQAQLARIRHAAERYLQTYFDNRNLIAALLDMSNAVPECAQLWWDLRERTYEILAVGLRRSSIGLQTEPLLAASALGAMVERFAFHWYVAAPRNGRDVPSIDRSADALSVMWYRCVFARPPLDAQDEPVTEPREGR